MTAPSTGLDGRYVIDNANAVKRDATESFAQDLWKLCRAENLPRSFRASGRRPRDPESIRPVCGYGFRARELRSRPGMTARGEWRPMVGDAALVLRDAALRAAPQHEDRLIQRALTHSVLILRSARASLSLACPSIVALILRNVHANCLL